MAETETSMLEPVAAKAGRLAVTITAAMFLVSRLKPRVCTPSRSSIDCRLCWVKGELRRVSPEPFSPTTRP